VIVTVREHIEAWLRAKSGETSKSTMAFYRGATSRFLTFLGPRADQSLLEISKIDLVNYRNTLAKSVSAVTTDHNMAVVKMVFLSAAQDDLIGDDPSEFLKSMNKGKTIAKRAFTKTEIQAVLSVADPEWRSMVLFGLYNRAAACGPCTAQLEQHRSGARRNQVRDSQDRQADDDRDGRATTQSHREFCLRAMIQTPLSTRESRKRPGARYQVNSLCYWSRPGFVHRKCGQKSQRHHAGAT